MALVESLSVNWPIDTDVLEAVTSPMPSDALDGNATKSATDGHVPWELATLHGGVPELHEVAETSRKVFTVSDADVALDVARPVPKKFTVIAWPDFGAAGVVV